MVEMILAEARMEALRATHPGAAQLALCVCLPVRVTPALVRLARLRLMPQAGTGDEADLWLSDLVAVRSGAGFTLHGEVRRWLRQRLAAQPALLAALWQQVHQAHAPWLTPRLRMEEELTWRLLRNPVDPEIDRLWAQVVQDLRGAAQAEGVARWVIRAMPELPDGSLLHPHGRLAHHGAHLVLGDASVLGDAPQQFLASADFAFATRHLPRQPLQVGWRAGRLLVSARTEMVHGHVVQVPATRPLWLQVEPVASAASEAAPAEQRVLLIDVQADVAELALEGDGPWRLRGLDGAAWELAPARDGAAASTTSPPVVPRVELSYPVEVYGARKRVHLPFVLGVLADLGQADDAPAPDLRDRRFVGLDAERLDPVLAAYRPALNLRVADPFRDRGELPVHLAFTRLADFDPSGVAAQLPSYQRWQGVMSALTALSYRLETVRLAHDDVRRLLANPQLLGLLQDTDADSATPAERERLGAMLEWPGLAQDPGLMADLVALARAAGQFGVAALTEPDLLQGLDDVRERIRQSLHALLAAVFQAPVFQRLEGTWRGLASLVARTPIDEMCKVQVLHITRQELTRALVRGEDDAGDPGVLYKKVHEEAFGQFGGEPFGLLLVDQRFDHQPADIATLQALARLGADCHAPVLAAASPSLFQLETWGELSSVRDLARLFVTPEYAAWRALRERDEARFLCLTLPPVLARAPWQAASSGDVPFDEAPEGAGGDRLCWMSSAHLLASNIAQAFHRAHWFARIAGAESGGLVRRLPTHGFHPGAAPELSPTGVVINDRMEASLAQLGLTSLVARRFSDIACFYSVSTLHQASVGGPASKASWPATETRLAPVLACSRLMLHLACMVRDRIGDWSGDLVHELQAWADGYVGTEPAAEGAVDSADGSPDRPFAAVRLTVERMEGDPEGLLLVATVTPRYQFAGEWPSLRLTHRLPQGMVSGLGLRSGPGQAA